MLHNTLDNILEIIVESTLEKVSENTLESILHIGKSIPESTLRNILGRTVENMPIGYSREY